MSEDNMFMSNTERTVFTFNMENLGEICFNHVFKKRQDLTAHSLSKEQNLQIEACVDKYMQALHVVKLAMR